MPPDGRGWGRGLMQIDYGSHRDFLDKEALDEPHLHLWEIPRENILYGCGILHSCLTTLRDVDAATAGYNAGQGNAFKALQVIAEQGFKGVDRIRVLDNVTFTKRYVSDCLRLMKEYSNG